jgi:Xaa-Pro aminopeptidase
MLTPAGCRGRIARLRAALDPGLDAVLVCRPEHVLYFANHYPLPNSLNLRSSSYLLIRRDGSTTLFTDNWLTPSTEAAADEIIVVEWYTGKEPARNRLHAVASAVASYIRAAAFKTVGTETAVLPVLVARSAGELVDIEALITSQREVKDPDEIAAIRLAIRTAEAVQAASRELLQPGMREIDYYATLLDRATRVAERPFVMMCDLASGERAAAGGGPPTTRVMQEGELVILDFFPYQEGYRGDISNTLCVGGRPTGEQKEAFERSLAALQAGEGLLRPGARAADVFAAMNGSLQSGSPPRNGSEGGERYSLKGHGGHAIGLGHPEPPHIVPRSDRTLSAGMVLTLEPGVYGLSSGGVRLEHNYLITADGFERLSLHRLGLD